MAPVMGQAGTTLVMPGQSYVQRQGLVLSHLFSMWNLLGGGPDPFGTLYYDYRLLYEKAGGGKETIPIWKGKRLTRAGCFDKLKNKEGSRMKNGRAKCRSWRCPFSPCARICLACWRTVPW